MNLLSLCVSLLSTDVTYSIKGLLKKPSVGCQTFGIFMHYFLLTNHTWAVTICYDVCMGLLRPFALQDIPTVKLFTRYSVMSWIPSTFCFAGYTHCKIVHK